MAASLNKVQLIGYVGQEPKIQSLSNGMKTATMSLATKERAYTTRNGVNVPERTDWHNLVAYYNIANVIESYVHKGSLLYIEGKLRTRSYEKDGSTHYVTEVIIDNMLLLDRQQPEQSVNNSNFS